MERRELPGFDPEETASSRSPRQNIDFMLATFPFGKVYLRGGTSFSTKEIVSVLSHKADAGVGLGLLWFAEGHLLAFAAYGHFVNGVTYLANGVHGLGARVWRAIKQPSL